MISMNKYSGPQRKKICTPVHIMKMARYPCFLVFFSDVVLQVSYNGSLSDTGNVPFRGTEINIGGHFSAANKLEIPDTGLYFIRSVNSLFSTCII